MEEGFISARTGTRKNGETIQQFMTKDDTSHLLQKKYFSGGL
jgi:hypothetical protein